MIRWTVRRMLQGVVVIVAAFSLAFWAMESLPTDPLEMRLFASNTAFSAETLQSLRVFYGYDQPVYIRYLRQLAGLFHGDFGYSLQTGTPVSERLADVAMPTVRLALSAVAIALLIALALARAFHATARDWLRQGLACIPAVFAGIPPFWLGLVLLQFLAVQLKWMSLFPDDSFLSHWVPAVVLAVPLSAPLSQVLLKRLDAVYQQDFITVLRTRGTNAARVFWSHALPNSLGALLPVLGLVAGSVLTGAVVTETVFSRPGLGKLIQDAVTTQDVTLVQGIVVITAIVFVVVNLLVDWLAALLDPRIAGAWRAA